MDLITSNLRDADAAMLNAYNETAEQSAFEGLVEEITDPQGYYRWTQVTDPAVFQKLIDEVVPAGLHSVDLTVETEVYLNPVEISRKKFDNASAIIDNPEWMRIFTGLGEDAAANREVVLTTLLESNPTTILGSAMFSNSAVIPGTNGERTIDNLHTGSGVDTESKIEADFRAAELLLHQMRNAKNRKMHRIGPRQKLVALIPPDLLEIFQQTFEKILRDAGEDNAVKNRVEIRLNTYFTSATDWYLGVTNSRYRPFGMVQEKAPELLTDAGATDAQNRVSRDAILRDSYLFGARDVFKHAPLFSAGLVMIDNS